MNIESSPYNRVGETAHKIRAFQQVRAGWHFGEGTPPGSEIVDKALSLEADLRQVGFGKTNAFLGVGGEIRVTGYYGSTYCELTVETDDTITFLIEQDGEETEYQEGLSIDKARLKVRGRVWYLSELFTQITSTMTWDGFKVLPLSRPLMAEYPLSTRTAFQTQAPAYVSTLQGTTQRYTEFRLYSGTSARIFSPLRTRSANSQAIRAMSATAIF